jgi:hydroxyacid-oxoacid transhydrogenase
VPHGWSVILTAPAAFRFTYEENPARHRQVAELLSGESINKADENTLPEVIVRLMQDVGVPRGLKEVGYDEEDIDQLVNGAMQQQRLLVLSPREVGEEDLANILRESMENW